MQQPNPSYKWTYTFPELLRVRLRLKCQVLKLRKLRRLRRSKEHDDNPFIVSMRNEAKLESERVQNYFILLAAFLSQLRLGSDPLQLGSNPPPPRRIITRAADGWQGSTSLRLSNCR